MKVDRMAKRLRMTIAYDGTDFHGWQRQQGVRTVQEELEDIFRRVANEPLNLVAASRTDTGVHARGQTVHIDLNGPVPPENLIRAVNHRLPADVFVRSLRETAPEFHSTRWAVCKLYRYRIWHGRRRPDDPRQQRYTWHYRFPLDLEAMRQAARAWIGTHDFTSFATQGSPRQTSVRTVSQIALRPVGGEIRIDIIGDGFLYNQVRNMVGTLVEFGRGHWPVEQAAEILADCDRSAASSTAPPQGLCLEWIRYPRIRSRGDQA
jgi:tRNA pseudouridine38-40 synthase